MTVVRTTQPALHGDQHLPDGSDPIPGLQLPGTTSDYPGYVLSLSNLIGYWRLGEGASPFADTSGVTPAADLERISFTVAMDTDVPGALAGGQDDGAVQFLAANTQHGDRLDVTIDITADDRFELAGSPYTVACWVKLSANTGTFTAHIVGTWQAATGGWYLGVNYPSQQIFHFRGTTAGPSQSFAQGPGVTAGEWVFVVATWDPAVGHELFYNGTSVDTDPGTTVVPNENLVVGAEYTGGPNFASYPGALDELAIWSRVLTDDEIATLYAQGVAAADGADEGDVWTSDGEGGTGWAPPAVEVEHGGGDPDEPPVSDSNPGLGPVNSNGWHLWQHTETVVLYDSTPGRFDVPSRKWTRVPFDTVRIWRRWEPTVGSPTSIEQWLADDRGLTAHAKEGILHVNASMAGDQTLSGYFSIEYPVLDYAKLPDDDPEWPGGGPRPSEPGTGTIAADAYVRAARLVNVSQGTVLRASTGSPLRHFFQWEMSDTADGIAVSWDYPVDNPYPIYPVWPGRPLRMPAPYPKLSPTASLAYYKDSVGNPGFTEDNLSLDTTLAAGANLALQAWQDSPWLLRFSTDHFPYINRGITPAYKNRPHLALNFLYDPDTIDHTTGKLLL